MRAFLLKKHPYSESDLVLHFLVENGSVVSGFGAGARRSIKRFPHRFHPLAVYDIEGSGDQNLQSDRLVRLGRVDLLEFYVGLDQDFWAVSRWALVAEWVMLDQSRKHSFDRVYALLHAFKDQQTRSHAWLSFLREELEEQGILAAPEVCARCQKSFGDDGDEPAIRWSLKEGQFFHERCGPGELLTSSDRLFFEGLPVANPERIEAFVFRMIEEHLGIHLRSWRVIADVQVLTPYAQKIEN